MRGRFKKLYVPSDALTLLLAADGAHGVSSEKTKAKSPIVMARIGSMGVSDTRGTLRLRACKPLLSHETVEPSF
jgi:hypothetical protein